ncbi:hypothetical protein Tcan_14485 [Toxocara canis]|uniref:Uncharacterized protein n=1 Tax=Toxocara canis TaxID=6265 RepID=A0A0B2VDS2_TOXCA|nr:hypothetical protein Tcan_14485 [Toxocara canis]
MCCLRRWTGPSIRTGGGLVTTKWQELAKMVVCLERQMTFAPQNRTTAPPTDVVENQCNEVTACSERTRRAFVQSSHGSPPYGFWRIKRTIAPCCISARMQIAVLVY